MRRSNFFASTTSALVCAFAMGALPVPRLLAEGEAVRPALARMAGLPLHFEATADPMQFQSEGRNYNLCVSPTDVRLLFRASDVSAPSLQSESEPAVSASREPTRAVRMTFVGANNRAQIQGQAPLAAKVNYLRGPDPAQWRSGVTTWSKIAIEDIYPGVNLVYHGNQQELEYDFTIAPGANPAVIMIRFDGADRIAVNKEGELVLKVGDDEVRQPTPVLYQMAGKSRRRVNGGYVMRDAHTVAFTVGKYEHRLPLIIDPILAYASLFGGTRGTVALAVKVDASGSIYLAGSTLSAEFPFNPTNAFQPTNLGGMFNGDAFIAKLDGTATNLIFFTYLGGSADDGVFDMALDSSNNVYVGGFTDSPDFPVVPSGGIPGLPSGQGISGVPVPGFNTFLLDGFVTELGSGGSNLVFSTYLGGSAADVCGAIAVDPSNNVYVTGYTRSTDFPILNPLVVAPLNGGTNRVFDQSGGESKAFVTKIAPGGSGLVYSTYLGGDAFTAGEGIVADAAGFAYVAGTTRADNFPVTTNAFQFHLDHGSGFTNGLGLFFYDAFVSQIAPAGSNLVFSTFLGGTNADFANRIALDANTNLYVTGYSDSPDFTNTVPASVIRHGIVFLGANAPAFNYHAFLTKISLGSVVPAIVYSSVFGGTNNNAGWDVAVDTNGNAFVVGITSSIDFPTANTDGFLAATNAGGRDVFVTAFNTNASAVLYSVLLGGTGNDYGYGIAVDGEDNAYIVGRTTSVNFPTVDPFETPLSWNNAFLAKIQLTVPTNTVVIQTIPTNLPVVVDGAIVTAPVSNNWLTGSVHTIGSAVTNGGGNGVQYLWTSWSDGGFVAHQVIASSNMAITAAYGTQYFLTMSNALGGVASPASGWYNAGTSVAVSATPGAGNTFAGWTGTGTGSFSGATNVVDVMMEQPISETANFSGPLTDVLTIIINGGGSVVPNYSGETLQVGQSYHVRAVPSPGNMFSGWAGGPGGSAPGLTFAMENGLVLEANFIPVPFPAASGAYSGLFFDTNTLTFDSAGYFAVMVSANGAFSAKLQVGPASYSLSGQFSASGTYSGSISRTNQNALEISLQLDLTANDAITGQISGGPWTSSLAAYRNIYSTFSPPSNAGAHYTWIIPGGSISRTVPVGDGFGALSVGAGGSVLLSGTLADGSAVSQSTFVTPQGQVPFFAPLYSGKGSVLGWLSFTNQTNTDVIGTVDWFKSPRPGAPLYTGGFALQSALMGSIYNSGAPLLSFAQGQVVLAGEQFAVPMTNSITVSGSSVSGPGVNMEITPASGLFHGTVANPNGGQPITVNGAVVQKLNLAAGYFLLSRQSGAVYLQP